MAGSSDVVSAAASADDAEARRQGIGFIDGTIPGYALLMGDDASQAPALIESLTRRQVVVFIVEDSLLDGLRDAGVSLGWEARIVPLDMTNALGFIARVAQIFDGAGSREDPLRYACQRLRGFTLLLGEPTPDRLALAQAALPLGCPLLSNADQPSSVEA